VGIVWEVVELVQLPKANWIAITSLTAYGQKKAFATGFGPSWSGVDQGGVSIAPPYLWTEDRLPLAKSDPNAVNHPHGEKRCRRYQQRSIIMRSKKTTDVSHAA
jgi:hypothetical protein